MTFAEPCSWLGSAASSSYRVEPCSDASAVQGVRPDGREHPDYGLQRRTSYSVDQMSCQIALAGARCPCVACQCQ